MSSQDFVDEVVLEINKDFDLSNDEDYEEIKMIIGEIVMERIQKTLNVFRLMEKHS
jgi:CRISPR/Cas system-associated protein Csx1